MTIYPEPGKNPKCLCWPNMMAAFFCSEGHMTECHAGMTCEEAECSHYQRELESEYTDDYEPDENYDEEETDVL